MKHALLFLLQAAAVSAIFFCVGSVSTIRLAVIAVACIVLAIANYIEGRERP